MSRLLLILLLSTAAWAAPGAELKPGSAIPTPTATDQFGKPQTFDSLKGPNGLVLVVFRSADW